MTTTWLTAVGLGEAVGARRREVLWQRCLARWPESLGLRTSIHDKNGKSASHHYGLTYRSICTHIPELSPSHEIRVVYPSLGIDVLARAHNHVVCRGHVAQGSFARVGMRNPYRNRESVSGTTEGDWYGAGKMEEEGRDTIIECFSGVLLVL
jgi:hypothetical protein